MISEILADAETKMGSAIEHARDTFAGIRTGRAHPAMFNGIMVDYYGSMTPLQQLASFQVPEARSVIVSPYDKGALSAIEKAIRDSDLGVNPSSDGNVLRLTMPQLTAERRKEYTKLAKTKAEEARVQIRNLRRDAKSTLDKMVKDKEAGEDEVAAAEKKLDALTKKHTDQVDDILKAKEAELLEV